MSKKSSIIFLIIALISISNIISWDYAQHGQDWTDEWCIKDQQSPGQVTEDGATELDQSFFFFASYNLKQGEKLEGTLESIEDNNILSLNFGQGKLGSIIYNIDLWAFAGENLRLLYDEGDLQETSCSNIMIKIPGEHSYNGEVNAAELQVNCTFQKERSTEIRGAFVAIPIKIDDATECQFSKALKTIVDNKITVDKLPYQVTFDNIDIIDAYAMMDGTFYYESRTSFPPCNIKSIWFYVNRPISFSQAVIDQLKNCIDKTKCPDGNNRINFEIKESYKYPK